MRQLFTLVFCAIGSFLFAQSNFTVFNNDGQQFYVIMNGIKQNSVPQTNVSVSGVKNGGYSVKVIFADGKTPDINKNFMIDAPMDITTRVVFKKGQGKLQLVSMQPTAGSVVNGAVIYRQDNNVIYSDAPIVNVQSPPSNTTITTTQTIPSNVNGNVQVNGTQTQAQTQTNTNTSNQNMNGSVNMNVGMNGNVGVNGTTSTNGQNGNVNMNTNVGSNGMNISVNDPISGENINMNLNVGFNTNGTTMTVSDPMMNGNINMNVDMNGMPITNSTSTSTVTTTSSQTINGQTTYQSGSTTTQNNNGNVTVTTTGTPNINGNVNMTTNMNTNPNTNGNVTVTTTGTPNMNGNVNMNTNPNGNVTVTTSGTPNMNGNVNMNTSSTMNGNGNGNTNVNSTNTINTSQNTNTTSTVVTNGNFINCTRMLLNTDDFIADLKTQKFEDDRVEIIYKDLVNTCVTSAQVYKILETITFEATKYEVAQFLYFRTSDRQLLDKGMLPLFIYDSTKMDWREFVRKNQ
jgi:hypothetical protein